MSPRFQLIINSGPPGGIWQYHPEAKREIATMTQFDIALAQDLKPKLKRLAHGSPDREQDIVYPLATAPELGEIKFFTSGRHYRLFFAEPPEHDGVIVALKFWRKSGKADQIRAAQNNAIAEACSRLQEWRETARE